MIFRATIPYIPAQCKKAELLNKVWTKKVLPLVWARCEAFDGALGAHLAAQQ